MAAHSCQCPSSLHHDTRGTSPPVPSWFLHCRGAGESRPELSGETERRPGSSAMTKQELSRCAPVIQNHCRRGFRFGCRWKKESAETSDCWHNARCSMECEMPGCKAPPKCMCVPRSQPAKSGLIGWCPEADPSLQWIDEAETPNSQLSYQCAEDPWTCFRHRCSSTEPKFRPHHQPDSYLSTSRSLRLHPAGMEYLRFTRP
jgi:hypothetical protein